MLQFLRIFKAGFFLSLQELWSNKMRTFLSLFGIAIGIFCVISVKSVIDSFENDVKNSFSKLGDDVIYLQRESWDEDPSMNWWKYVKRPYPSYKEFKLLSKKLSSADLISIRVIVSGKDLKYKSNVLENMMIAGATYNFGAIYNMEFENGRYWTAEEAHIGKNYIVLGSKLAESLFPASSYPVGKEIKFMGKKVKVVGVLKREGESMLGDGTDNLAIVPYEFLRKFMDVNSRSMMPLIAIKAKPGVSLEQLKDESRGLLRASRKLKPKEEDNFAFNQLSILKTFLDNIFGIMGIAGGIIGLFSMIVGAFGIANIMFVSVKERTKIIGIKKSLGAKSHHVLWEFLSESIILTIFGGLLGIIAIIGLFYLGNQMQEYLNLQVSLENVILGFGISAFVGLLAGIIPAFMASRLSPVVAMRS